MSVVAASLLGFALVAAAVGVARRILFLPLPLLLHFLLLGDKHMERKKQKRVNEEFVCVCLSQEE